MRARSSLALAWSGALLVASCALRARAQEPASRSRGGGGGAPDAPAVTAAAQTEGAPGEGPPRTSAASPDAATPVFGARARASRGSADLAASSDTDLALARLHDVPRARAEELLTLAPGVLLGNHGGDGHASTLFFRGFDAGEGQDVEMTVDGVPFNDPSNAHGHGYADAGFLIPELVERVRVVEGPFDARQGDFALAGSADYTLGLAERGARAKVELGTYGHQRLLLSWGPEAASRHTFVGVALARGEGFGPSRASTAATALAQLEVPLGHGLRGALFATGHVADFASAGVVRLDDVAAGRLACPAGTEPFYCVADPSQGGASARTSIGARAAWQRGAAHLEHAVWIVARRLRLRENFTGQLLDARGDGLDALYDTTTIGARGRYRFARRVLGRRQALELGFLARRTAGVTRQDRLRSDGGAPYATVFDDTIALTNVGAWAAITLRPLSWIALRGGLRAEAFGFAVERRGLPMLDRDGARLGLERVDALGIAIAPRGSVTLRLARGLAWTTSAGVGTRSTDAQALSDGERAPFAQATAAETGLALEAGAPRRVALDLRAALFATRVTRDFVFDAERGRNSDVGPSSRFGALLAAQLRAGRWLEARVSGAWTEAHLVSPEAGPFALAAGPRLPYVPRFVARADVAARRSWRIAGQTVEFGASLGLTALAARPLPLGTFGEPYALVDAALRARWRSVELAVVARNVLDARWRAFELAYPSRFGDGPASMLPATHIAAGPPFTAFVSLSVAVPTGAADTTEMP